MWKKALSKVSGLVGGFLSSKAITAALLAALGAGGTYVAYVMKDRGTLEERLRQGERNTAQAQAEAQAWKENADANREIARRIDAIDQQLRQSREAREQEFRVVNERIAGISIEFPEVRDFLDRPAPVELVRVLCNDGTIDARSADCQALDTRPVSGGL